MQKKILVSIEKTVKKSIQNEESDFTVVFKGQNIGSGYCQLGFITEMSIHFTFHDDYFILITFPKGEKPQVIHSTDNTPNKQNENIEKKHLHYYRIPYHHGEEIVNMLNDIEKYLKK